MKGLETIMGNSSFDSRCHSLSGDANFAGYVGLVGQYAVSDCVLVEVLYQCGAVPFVRTNVPQTLVVRIAPSLPDARARG